MTDVRAKYVPPAIDRVSFNCPHCGALAKQFWFSARADELENGKTPPHIDADFIEKGSLEYIEDIHLREQVEAFWEQLASGRPFLKCDSGHGVYCRETLENVFISRCFSCNDVAIWIYDRLVWPQNGEAPLPNPDLPDDIRRDYEEANTILDLSPRGAAALLRLAIQKLCKHLGEKGKNINDDISALVKKGLDSRVQRALDVVRVIGNNAVHPGQIDLRDDRGTAAKLFGLVNLIADIMISQPKHIHEMFEGLPESARNEIKKRDSG